MTSNIDDSTHLVEIRVSCIYGSGTVEISRVRVRGEDEINLIKDAVTATLSALGVTHEVRFDVK